MVCLACGYDFNLYCTTHIEMLNASIQSFEKNDSSEFVKIFSKAVVPLGERVLPSIRLAVLTSDDLLIEFEGNYEYYNYQEYNNADAYNKLYEGKIQKMNAEKIISDAKHVIENNNHNISLSNVLNKNTQQKTHYKDYYNFER